MKVFCKNVRYRYCLVHIYESRYIYLVFIYLENSCSYIALLTILSVFFGFKFLPNKEEKNNFPPEEGGILEEFLPLDLEYISPVQIQL